MGSQTELRHGATPSSPGITGDISLGTSAYGSSVHDVPVTTAADRGLPQTQASVQQAIGGAKTINWTTPEQDKKSGQQPNYIVKPDGSLQVVHKPDNPNAPVTVEVEGKNKSLNDAIKNANENQKKAIKSLIANWKKEHPHEQVPSDWTDQLNAQPALLPSDNNNTGGSSPRHLSDNTGRGSSSGGGGGGGSSGGGGAGGDGSSSGGVGGSGSSGGSSGGGDNSVSPSGAQLSGGEKATSQQIMDTLTQQYGLSKAGAAAVVGNMTQENGLSTADNSGGMGLIQWIGDRRTAEINYANQHHESPTSVQAQLGFMMQELKGYPGLLQELKTTNNPQLTALHFEQQYERAGQPNNGNRESYAQSAYNNYHGSSSGTRTA